MRNAKWIYHIFAVDGLRMAISFGIFFCLFRALRLPRSVCGLVLIPLIWFYAALAGWPASAIWVTSHWFADWPCAYFYVPESSLFTSGLYYLVLGPGWIFRPTLRAWKIAAPMGARQISSGEGSNRRFAPRGAGAWAALARSGLLPVCKKWGSRRASYPAWFCRLRSP